jgi:hypothetical protein
MRSRGQILIILAFLIPIALLIIGVAIDVGRLYRQRAQVERAAQSAANAGVSALAEEMATLAFARYEDALSTPSATPDPLATPEPTPEGNSTPPSQDLPGWLQDEDRAALTVDPIRSRVIEVVELYASLNELDTEAESIQTLEIIYPQLGFNAYNPGLASLRLSVRVRGRSLMLLAGLVGREYVDFSVEAASQLQIR